LAPPRTPRCRGFLFALLAAAPGLLLAAWQAAFAWPFFSDDSFISLRYADRLLAGEGLTWTDGERVEGYSNLLWVLACSALGAFGVDLVAAARVLGAVCTATALVILAGALRPADLRAVPAAAVGPLLVAAGAPIMTWTLGGLEGPAVLLWLAWGGAAVVGLLRNGAPPPGSVLRAGLPFACLCLTRPDGPLWTAVTAAVIGFAARPRGARAAVREALRFGALPAAAVAAQLAFRVAYYGDVVPNTAHVKIDGFDAAVLGAGLGYVARGLLVVQGVAGLGLLGAIVLGSGRASRAAAMALALPVAAWLAYLAYVGGDHFPGYRLLHGALAPLALLAALGLRRLAAVRHGAVLAPVLAIAGVGGSLLQSRTDALSIFARDETWEWHGKGAGEVLAAAFGEQRPRIAVDAAGALPYYSRLPALDMLGLCDRTIATSPPPAWVADAVRTLGVELPAGHKRGNGRYVMDRAPDLMLFGTPPGLPMVMFVSGLDFEDDPRFLDGYRCVVVDAGERELRPGMRESLSFRLWVRCEGRVGIRRTEARIDVPAWLLGAYQQTRPILCRHAAPRAGEPGFEELVAAVTAIRRWFFESGDRFSAAVPEPSGELRLELRAARRAELELRVPAGRWRVAVDPPEAAVEAALDLGAGAGAAAPVAPGGVDVAVECTATLAVAAKTATPAAPVRLRSVSLVRAP
jgi:hypothetical protein